MVKTKEISISEIGNIFTGNTPPRKNPEYYGNHTLFIKPTDISKETKYTYTPEECYSKLAYEKYKNSLVPKGATCVVTIGSIGEKLTKAHKECFINQAMNAVVPNENFDEDYVYYLLKFNLRQLKMFDSGTASGRENVSKSAFSNIRVIALTSKDEQIKVGKLLSNYDDLIENNNRRIKILEEMAQKIYKEWFVDFKFPGHETATFKDSPLGKIPNDWEVSNLENILSCIESGSRPKGGINSNDTEIPSVGAENIIGLGKYDYNKEKYISNEFYKKMKRGKIQDLDVLLYKDGAQLGRKSIFGENFPHSKCCINEHVFILRTNEKCSQYYLYFTLDTISNTERIKQLNTNAAQPGINQEQVKGLTIILPQRKIIEKFDDIIGPIVSEIFKLCIKNQTLKQTRDLLLPRLISGEIDVENMEIA